MSINKTSNHAINLPDKIGALFIHHDRQWRCTVITDNFIIGTATDAELNARGEPLYFYDITKVNK